MLPPLVSTWFQVLFHSPKRGSFHRSLTLLVHYRLPKVFSLRRWSSLIHAGFHVTGITREITVKTFIPFTYGTITLYSQAFLLVQLEITVFLSKPYLAPRNSLDPDHTTHKGYYI